MTRLFNVNKQCSLIAVYCLVAYFMVRCMIVTFLISALWQQRTPLVEHLSQTMHPSSSVLRCWLCLLPIVLKTCYPHSVFEISFPGVLWLPSSSLALQCSLWCYHRCRLHRGSGKNATVVAAQLRQMYHFASVLFCQLWNKSFFLYFNASFIH